VAAVNPGLEKNMTRIRNSLFGLCIATASFGALAQAQKTDDHKDHHPPGSTVPTAPGRLAPGTGPARHTMGAMDQHMKAMQAMHEKMASAKSPAERQALMTEHMKMMQDGMSMMKQMGGMQGGAGMSANLADRQNMMEKRMAMMESMMQMMMDRLPAAPAR